MSYGITLEQAQENLNNLLSIAQDGILQTTINGRTTIFRSLRDIRIQIEYWREMIAMKQRIAATGSRHNYAVADLSSRR